MRSSFPAARSKTLSADFSALRSRPLNAVEIEPTAFGPEIVIGLVNIMPAAAMISTENLFRTLLQAAPLTHNIQLRFFAPGGVAIEANGKTDRRQHYEDLEDLWRSGSDAKPVDALIVTGTEPKAAAMQDEPLWPQLQKLCDWAAKNTISTLWSCFSAHAAVLHLDGIQRRKRDQKLSGIFECRKAANHVLLRDLPEHWPVPHSRYNGLDAAELAGKGYEILSHGSRIGVDSFAKQHGKSTYVFLQGHPEYGPQILFGEYSRDMKRFIAGEHGRRPSLPENYLDTETEKLLASLAAAAGTQNHLFRPEFAEAVSRSLAHSWREPARRLYAAWLCYISGQKQLASEVRHVYGA